MRARTNIPDNHDDSKPPDGLSVEPEAPCALWLSSWLMLYTLMGGYGAVLSAICIFTPELSLYNNVGRRA